VKGDSGDDGGVREGGLGGEDGVRDAVTERRVLLLLDSERGSVLELPLEAVAWG
jgi:hypothetical protein